MGFIANAFLIKPYFSGRPGHSGSTLFPHFCWHRYFFQPGCPLALHSNRVSSSPCFHCEFPWKIFKTGNPLISSPRSVSIEMHRITFGVRSCFLYISTILKCLTCETARAIVVPTIFNTGLRLNVYVEPSLWRTIVRAVASCFILNITLNHELEELSEQWQGVLRWKLHWAMDLEKNCRIGCKVIYLPPYQDRYNVECPL